MGQKTQTSTPTKPKSTVAKIASVLGLKSFTPSSLFDSARQTSDSKVVRSSYHYHTWHYSAVNAIKDPLSLLPRLLVDTSSDDADPIRKHPILDVLNKPNPAMSGSNLWEATLLGLLLPTAKTPGGQCFWIGLDSRGKIFDWSKGGVPDEIFPYTDNVIEARKDDNGILNGWIFNNGKTKRTLELTEVLRFHLYNPSDPHLGLSPWSAAQNAIKTDLQSDAMNISFYKNGAHLGGTLTTADTLTENELKSTAIRWNETYSGSDKAGNTAILHAGLKYDKLMQSHVDMEFIAQKNMSKSQTLAAYRVPRIAVSDMEDSTYANAKAAYQLFWENTLIPYDNRINFVINHFWLNENNREAKGLALASDKSDVSALQNIYTEQIKNLAELSKMHVPVSRGAELLQIPLNTEGLEFLDTAYVTSNTIPIEMAGTSAATEGVANDSSSSSTPNSDESKATPMGSALAAAKKITLRERRVEALGVRAVTETTKQEKSYKVDVIKFFNTQRNEVLRNIDTYFSKFDQKSKSIVVVKQVPQLNMGEILPSKDKEDTRLQLTSKPHFFREVSITGDLVSENIDIDNWVDDGPSVNAFIGKRLKTLGNINATTYRALTEAFTVAQSEALNSDIKLDAYIKVLKTITKQKYVIRNKHANTISRTEMNTISAWTRNDIFESENIEEIQWLTAADELTRDSHKSVNLQIVKRGEAFSNGLLHPHQEGASADEVINCRCTHIAYEPD